MRLQMSGLWKKVKYEMGKDKTFAKKHNNYNGSQLKISRFKTYFTKFQIPNNEICFTNRAQRFIAPTYLDVDSPINCFQGSFTNSYNHK